MRPGFFIPALNLMSVQKKSDVEDFPQRERWKIGKPHIHFISQTEQSQGRHYNPLDGRSDCIGQQGLHHRSSNAWYALIS